MRIAVIPARGGSKRIPRKNIKLFSGKPMIAWSIAAALESECFEHVIVSTDDAEIADIARQCGAGVPFMRPDTLSDDYTGTTEVVAHALEWFASYRAQPTLACCLYATAPFVTASDLRIGHDELMRKKSDYAFSVTSYPFPIQRAIRITPANRVEMFNAANFDTRSQDLEEAYHDAGQFYWGRADAWQRRQIIFSPASVPIVLPRHRVQDIDTIEDWIRAEWMFKAMQAQTTDTAQA